MSRTAKQRLEAIEPAIAARDAFLARVAAVGSQGEATALMAEAIDMQIAANGLDPVGHDGRAIVAIEEIAAAHCLIAARDAYRAFMTLRLSVAA